MNEVFEQISKNLKAKYTFTSEKFWGYQGSSLTVDYHNLTIPFKEHLITVQYEFGNHNMGYIISQLNVNSSMPNFSIESKGQFKLLFNKRQDILTIKCKDNNFKDFVKHQLCFLGIEKFARGHLFEPEFLLTSKKELKASFYLGFENKTDIIEPLVKLFKELIKKYS